MKKIFMALLCMSFFISGCTWFNRNKNNANNDNQPNVSNQVNNTYTFDRFENDLRTAGIEIKDKAENMASHIGAREGYRYQSSDGHIEVYHFEDDEKLNMIKQNKYIEHGGRQYPVEVFGNWVLITNDLAHEEQVRDIFNNMR